MGKVYESDIDPDEFIRSFREEPSGTSGLKKTVEESDRGVNTPTENSRTKSNEKQPKQGCQLEINAEEVYRQKFLLDMSYMRSQRKFQPVEIDPEHIQKIKRIISYERNRVCTVKAYVNNVLAEHFTHYNDIIEKRL